MLRAYLSTLFLYLPCLFRVGVDLSGGRGHGNEWWEAKSWLALQARENVA